jgi:hypothetical protein
LGTFWLKIEKFWPFEEISIFSNSGYIELRELQPNFGGMVLGWPPFKIVSGVPDFQPRWPPS